MTSNHSDNAGDLAQQYHPAQVLILMLMLVCIASMVIAGVKGNLFAALGFTYGWVGLGALNLSLDREARKWLLRLLRMPADHLL